MSRKALRRFLFPVLLLVLMAGVVPAASAQSESWKVINVLTTGCASSATTLTTETANLDFSNLAYAITVVTVGGKIYMSENAGQLDQNTTWLWSLYNSSSYGPVDAFFPLPPGQEVRIDLRLERPLGNVVYGWALVLDGCDTGNILFNGQTYPPAAVPEVCGLAVPSGSVVGEAPLGAQAYWEPGKESPGIVLNPGTYIVTGQDETETYYRVVLGCQFVWVRKDTMGPSWLPPQNGTALPTTIVN